MFFKDYLKMDFFVCHFITCWWHKEKHKWIWDPAIIMLVTIAVHYKTRLTGWQLFLKLFYRTILKQILLKSLLQEWVGEYGGNEIQHSCNKYSVWIRGAHQYIHSFDIATTNLMSFVFAETESIFIICTLLHQGL